MRVYRGVSEVFREEAEEEQGHHNIDKGKRLSSEMMIFCRKIRIYWDLQSVYNFPKPVARPIVNCVRYSDMK